MKKDMQLIADYESGKLTPETAKALGIKWQSLQRRVQRAKKRLNLSSHSPLIPPNPTPRLNTSKIRTETEQFYDRLHNMREKYIRVMHLADIHYPYQDNGAVEIAVQLVGFVQPHVCVLGSDEFDFMRLSKFDIDPRQSSLELDDIDLIRLDHHHLVDKLIMQSPSTIFVWIFGNHDYRLYKYLLKNSPNVATTVMREFSDMVRYQGRVLFMGETDQVKIHNLIVAHGSKAGQNPAKQHLELVSGQINYMAGHCHRRSFWQKTGYQYNVVSITSGCLCDLQPHYRGFRQDKMAWEHGTAIAEIKAFDDQATAQFDNLRFDNQNGILSVRYQNFDFEA